MSKESKNEILIENIFDKIGGSENIKDVYHCATRMRLTLFNQDSANLKELKTITNIKGALWSNGELQLIIGPVVSKVTQLLKNKLTSFKNKDDKVNFKVENNLNSTKVPIWKRLIKSVSAIFGPLIPFLIGVGLIMALEQLLLRTGLVHNPNKENAILGQDYNIFDVILNVISSTGFKMMGVIAIWSTVRYLGGKTPIAIALGLIMVNPILPEKGINLFTIGSWEVALKPFYSTILVFIAMGILVAYCQKLMEKYFNPVANFILNPFLTLLVGGLLAFFVMGPIMGIVENSLLNVFNWFMNWPLGLGTMIVGLTWQPLVVLGVHNILFFAAVTDLSTTGRPSLFLAAAFAAAWAQMGATVAVGLKSKKTIDKSAAFAAVLPGVISGPTESCIYGVNLPKGLPFITGTLAGAIGGWMIGILGVSLDNLAGLGGIVGFLAYTNHLALAIAIDLLSFALGIVITYFLWKEEKTEKQLAIKTTKKLARDYYLNQDTDFSAKKLIYYLKKVSNRKIKNKELISNILLWRKKLIDIDSNLEKQIDLFIEDLLKEKYNAELKKEIIIKLNSIKSNRQKQLRDILKSLFIFNKQLNKLNPYTKEHYKLLIKKSNLQYSLNKTLEINEEKSVKLFNKGKKLIISKDPGKVEIGELLIKTSGEKNLETDKVKNLNLEIEKQNVKINDSYINLSIETQKYYSEIEETLNKMEKLMNESLINYKNNYYNNIHYLQIKENQIQIR
ncbi:PTS transporter subunit EIIC [Spiroplasma floricola]|uniref:PTS system, sucrose-specific IIABC component n=1 Tax=Spiroplasma floricola 23-6 TaxID=1336749 RepID=A0A2K8SEE3_9MOLU|nr:PTS transporter subunit EIIC [Spiroplasma floricola]AUB31725.1 PTS system, sucrose-specific IIABC component [Spiroplasma floricola 23-6]